METKQSQTSVRRTKKMGMWLILAAVLLLMSAPAARAAMVTAVGTIQDNAGNEISQWRTAATAKTLDADGDNIYGSDAKLFYRVMGDYGSYVQYISSESQVGPYGGYAVVDHPNDVSADIQVRTTTSGNVGVGTLRNMFTFAINGTPPALGFRVGVAFDGLNGAQYSPQEIRLTQTTGGTASASVNVEPFRNSTLDMTFFDVTGAVVGDRFTIQGVSGAGGYATHQIVTWDAIVSPPTPGALVMNFDVGPLGGLAGDGGLSQTSYTSVDFDGDGSPDVWNNYGQIAGNTPFGGVQDIDGNEVPGVTLMAQGVSGRDGNTTLNAGWGTAQDVPQQVINSWYYKGAGTIAMTIAGLDPSKLYDVELFNAFNTGTNLSDMMVNGQFADGTTGPSSPADGDNWNRNVNGFAPRTGLLFSGVSPTGGSLVVSTFTGGNPTLQAIRITEQAIPATDIPEPATMAMLGLAVAGLGGYVRRRRRQKHTLGRKGSTMETPKSVVWMVVLAGIVAGGLFASQANAATIGLGDAIKLDFSNTGDGDGGSLADWNRTTNAAAPIPAGSVIRHGDGAVVDGLAITFSGGGGGHGNDGASANWAGTAADPYYILAADDIYYGPGALTTTFSGLDTSLGYNVRIASLIGNNAGFVDRFTVTGVAVPKDTLRGARWAAATLEDGGSVFTGLSPDALGNLSVTVGGVSNAYYPLNAIVLEATAPGPPPPAILGTWDFETGDLTGWNIVNTVHGNNLVFTTPGNMPTQMPATGYNNATVQGDYFVRTWDGNVLGNSDVPTGIIESDSFVLGADASFSMLVGGGGHGFSGDPDSPNANMTALTLERLVGPNDWEMIFVESGGGNALSGRFWDAGAYEGETVRLRIYDTHTGGWGHIGVDNIIYSARAPQPHGDIPEPATMAMLGLAVAGLGGYIRKRRAGREI